MPHNCFKFKNNLKGPDVHNKRTQNDKTEENGKKIRHIQKQINYKTTLFQN